MQGEKVLGPTQRALVEARLKTEKSKDVVQHPEHFKRHPKVVAFFIFIVIFITIIIIIKDKYNIRKKNNHKA